MCVTRVARVISTQGTNAKVLYLDSELAGEVDTTMVPVRKGSYVEIFADQAIGRITKKEAEFKRELRLQIEKARGTST
jgi:prefoldin subunit 5